MSNRIESHHGAGLWLASAVVLAGLVGPSLANEKASQIADPSRLRVCASEVEAPYSSRDGEGFENKIAKALADAMGRKLSMVWLNKPAIYLVRDQLDKKDCDVVIGLDTGDERVLTSKPYYRAPYVFVLRKDSPLDITSWDSPDLLKARKIGVAQDTPAQVMLEKLGLFNANFNYMKSLTGFKSKRNQYVRVDPQRYVDEVASGKADLAIVFAPEVARYAKQRGDQVKLVVVPDSATRGDGQHVPFHFDQSIGVRKDDKQLLDQVNAALEKARPEIETILKEEGIPLDAIAKTPEGRAG
ncbi:MAG: methanol oxidation system protein MoxJ [Hyphomicrobium sp.]